MSLKLLVFKDYRIGQPRLFFLQPKKTMLPHCSTNCTGCLWERESTTKPCCMFTNALLVWGQIIWHPPWHYISLEDKDFDLLLMPLACMCPKSITGHSNLPLTRHLLLQLQSCGTSYLFQSAPPTLCLCSKKSWKPICFLKFNAFCLYTCFHLVFVVYVILFWALWSFEMALYKSLLYVCMYMYVCLGGKNAPILPFSHSVSHQRPARERHKICIASWENVDKQMPRNTNFTH